MSREIEPIPTAPAVRFEDSAKVALANTQLRRNMGKVTQAIRGKRQLVVDEMPDWEALREAGRAIKERTLRHLDTYLLQLEGRSRGPAATSTGRATPPRRTGSSPGSSPARRPERSSRSRA